MKPAEILLQKRVTEAFIDANPSQITLRRQSRTRNDRGGYTLGVEEDLAAQKMRLTCSRPARNPQSTTAGPRTLAFNRLVAKVGANLEEHDRFTHDGVDYEVTRVTRRVYEVLAEIAER